MFYSRQLSNEKSDEDSDNNKASCDHVVSIPTNKLSNLYHLWFKLMMLIALLPLFLNNKI